MSVQHTHNEPHRENSFSGLQETDYHFHFLNYFSYATWLEQSPPHDRTYQRRHVLCPDKLNNRPTNQPIRRLIIS